MGTTTLRKHQWLSDQIRQEILGGRLPAGHKLRPDVELMAEYGVSRTTVVQAMKSLQQQGFVRRKVGSGTYVRDRLQSGTIPILVHRQLLGPESTPIWNMHVGHLVETIQQGHPQWHGQIHPTDIDPQRGGHTIDLFDRPGAEHVLGVFTLNPLHQSEDLFIRRQVPLVYIGQSVEGFYSGRVFYELESIAPLVIEHLAQAGCRTVGCLWESQQNAEPLGRLAPFNEALQRAGLHSQPEWMVYAQGRAKSEQTGWELFHRLWRQRSRPDAIFVDDDLTFRGVARAALELGVRFPEDLRVVTISPRGAPLPYHKPVTVVEFDTLSLTQEAVRMMERLLRKDRLPQREVVLPVQLVKGQTT